jgi:4-hydroxy-4-methyl-2-oxoglutarate aldolase
VKGEAAGVPTGVVLGLRRLGVATVYEASGRRGLVDAPLERVVAGSRTAGPARTVLCGQGDNLAVHAALARVQRGEVLVLAMPEPVALVGEVIALQAKVRGAAGLLIDGAIRDADELRELGLPVWARFVRAGGAAKEEAGELDVPVTVGGVRVKPGDVVVMDGDGAVVVQAGRAEEVLEAGRRREADEAAMMEELRAGALTLDLMGLREKLGAEGGWGRGPERNR